MKIYYDELDKVVIDGSELNAYVLARDLLNKVCVYAFLLPSSPSLFFHQTPHGSVRIRVIRCTGELKANDSVI